MIAAAVDFFTPDIKIHFTQWVQTNREGKKRMLLIPAEAKLIFHK